MIDRLLDVCLLVFGFSSVLTPAPSENSIESYHICLQTRTYRNICPYTSRNVLAGTKGYICSCQKIRTESQNAAAAHSHKMRISTILAMVDSTLVFFECVGMKEESTNLGDFDLNEMTGVWYCRVPSN